MKTPLFAGLVAAAVLASPGYAHTHLASAVPADGSTVTTAPAEFVLTFSEPARLTALSVQKDGAAAQKITALPTTTASQAKVAAPALGNGHYTLNWKVVGKDGHVVDGKLGFTVGGKAAPGKTPEAAHHEGHAQVEQH